MTNTYNTGNPLGSTDPRDLYDNASNFDEGMNTGSPSFEDRKGILRKSWKGMEVEFNLAQSGRQAEFLQFLDDSSFVPLGNYAAGMNFTLYNQYMARGGFLYRPAASSIPFTTTGTWDGADENLFSLFTADDVLRQDLNNDSDPVKGAGIIGFSSSLSYAADTVGAELKRVASAGDLDVRAYGAVGDGVTDDSAAFAAARTAAAASGKFVYAAAGTYKLNTALTSSEALRIKGDGDSTVLDFTGAVAGGDYALEAIGTATQIQELSGTQEVGTHGVLFISAPSLVPGDVFVIFNPAASSWSGFRTNYFAGEWCEVEAVSGNLVTVKSPLYDSYPAASVDIYKITGPAMVLRDFKIKGSTVTGLIHPQFCRDVEITNVSAEHANDSAIYLDRCFKPTVNNPNISNIGDGGDDYGIAVGNSQHCRITGGSVYSRRHAVTHGGGGGICSVPVRDSRVTGVLLRNDINSGTESADFHGNTEDSSFIDCTIYNGGNLQGKDNHYDGCTITNALSGYALYHSEVKGGRLGAKNCVLKSFVNPQTGGRGIHDIGGGNDAVSVNTVLPCTFFLRDCAIYARNWTSSSYITRFRNAGTIQTVNFELDGISLNANALGAALLTSLDAGTASSSRIIVDRLSGFPDSVSLHSAGGAHYLNAPHRLQSQGGQLSLTATTGTAVAIAPPTTLKYAYPRTPEVQVTCVGDIVGNRYPSAGVFSISTTSIRPQIFTGDQVNWTATAARTVSWKVGISEI